MMVSAPVRVRVFEGLLALFCSTNVECVMSVNIIASENCSVSVTGDLKFASKYTSSGCVTSGMNVATLNKISGIIML